MGLQRDLSLVVKTQKPVSLEDAIQYAIAEECEQKSRSEIQKYQNLGSRETRYCTNCNRAGHSTIQCYGNKNRPMNFPQGQSIKQEPNIRQTQTQGELNTPTNSGQKFSITAKI